MDTTPTWRPLGRSGLKVPPLWLGAMMFGDQTDESEAAAIVDAARAAGLTAIDTADIYAAGRSEQVVGRLIRADRDRWIVATKVANPVGAAPNDRGLSRRWILREVEASLRRLDSGWIDLYCMHRDDESTPMEETLATMARLIEQGRIRYYGVSNFRAWRVALMVQTAKAMGVPPPIASQSAYSLVTRGVPPQQLAIAWVLANRLVHGVIAGPRTLAQWRDYVAALQVPVTADDERWVDARVPPGHASTFGYTDPIYPVAGRVVADHAA
jgi:aryl-alcohol dehydrogenase-like predicted oxidoreductase